MNIEWIEGFIIFSLLIWCIRNEVHIRKIKNDSIPSVWKEIDTLHKNDSSNHSTLASEKVIYDWKEEKEYEGIKFGGTITPLNYGGGSGPITVFVPAEETKEVPGKKSKVYVTDYIPLKDLLDLILGHIGMQPIRVPKKEEPKPFSLKKVGVEEK